MSIRSNAGTSLKAFGRGSRRRASMQASQPARRATAPADAGGDVVSQIERLGRLREQGLLTDEEFQAQKEKILAN
jgi:Short C-terminal domain